MKLPSAFPKNKVIAGFALGAAGLTTAIVAYPRHAPVHHTAAQLSRTHNDAVIERQQGIVSLIQYVPSTKFVEGEAALKKPFDLMASLKSTDNRYPMLNAEREFFINLLSSYSGQDVAKLSGDARVKLANQYLNAALINKFAKASPGYFTSIVQGTDHTPLPPNLTRPPEEMFPAQLQQNLIDHPDAVRTSFIDAILPKTPIDNDLAAKLANLKGAAAQKQAIRASYSFGHPFSGYKHG